MVTALATKNAYTAATSMLRKTFLLSAEQLSARIAALPFPIIARTPFVVKLRDRDPMLW